jgi:hypothetical protein
MKNIPPPPAVDESEMIRRWSIQRGLTPKERYSLGPTGTWHTLGEYVKTIVPLWCPLSQAWAATPALPPASCLYTLARGGILETNYCTMTSSLLGSHRGLYVCDSIKTRDVIQRLQGHGLRSMAWRFIKTRLIQDTFQPGWTGLFRQAVALRYKLDQPDWRNLIDGRALNLRKHIRVGEILDAGELPPDLLPIALRLISVWLLDYLDSKHPERGIIDHNKKGIPRTVLVVYDYSSLVLRQQLRTVDFYRANLYNAPATFKRTKRP